MLLAFVITAITKVSKYGANKVRIYGNKKMVQNISYTAPNSAHLLTVNYAKVGQETFPFKF